jgi:predicted RND superfamily exporter protein
VKRFSRFVTCHPGAVIAFVALTTLAALHGIVDLRSGEVRLRIDPGIDRLLSEGDDERRFYDRARQLFGNDQTLLLVLETDDVFAPEALAEVQRIDRRVKAFPGIQRVISLASAIQIEERAGDVYVGPFFEEVPTEPAARAELRAAIAAHPIYRSLVSPDARTTALLLTLGDVSDSEFVERQLSEAVLELARAEAPGAALSISGVPHVKLVLSRTILEGLRFILPTVLAIPALLLLLSFRTPRGVVLPMVAIVIAEVWTLGGLGWTDTPLNLVTNIVPPLIITLGFAAAVHVVSEYYELLHHHPAPDRTSHRRAVEQVLNEMGLTVAVNGLTTVLGFLSLLVSSVTAVREFGLWA